MSVKNVKRWQWVVVSLIVGVALGYVQRTPTTNWRKAYGDTLTRAQFEEGLVREQSGRRWFRNIVAYPHRVDDVGRGSLPVLIVAGDYFNGTLDQQDGQSVAIWKPRCFISTGAYEPYAPAGGVKPFDSVLGYLKSVKGADYVYAWWRDPDWAIPLWTAGSFVMIGLIWPTVINLIAFGSFTRPKEAPGTDLSHVSTRTGPAASATREADLDAVARMGDELEAKLAAEAVSSSALPTAEAEPAPVKALTGAPVESPVVASTNEAMEFGAEAEDYYPTERHKPHA